MDLAVKVWEKAASGWAWVGDVATWSEVSLEQRHLQAGTWSLTMPYDAQALRVTKTRLLTFDFRNTRMTGVVTHIGPASDENGKPILEASGVDALALLGDATCWPAPAEPLTAQTAARYKVTGNVETVLRNLIAANMATRRGDDITVPASAGRGGTVTLNERFSNLLAVVAAKAERGGVGVRMGLVQTTSSTKAEMRVEFWEPDVSARATLSHRRGTLRSWRQSDQAPVATFAIVGGQGQGMNRTLRPIVAAAAETEWQRRIETFVDARDVEKGSADEATLLDERGREALDEAAEQSSFELEAVEAEGMRYGAHFRLGDLVTVELLTGLSKVDRLRAVRISAGTDGMTVQLVPGNPDAGNPLFAQAAIMRAVRRQVKALEREETA